MYNIIRSVNFSTRRNMAVVITILSMLTGPILFPLLMGLPLKELGPDLYFSTFLGELAMIWIFPVMILSAIVSSGDAGDRTINYEILAGRGRKRIFAARTVNGLVWGAGISAFFLYLPLLYLGLLNGWPFAGLNVGDVILRILLSLLPMARLAAFIIMLSVLFRSAGKGIGFGYLILEVLIMIYEIIADLLDGFDGFWMTGMYSMLKAVSVDNSRDFMIEGERVTVYETALKPDVVIPIVLSSLLMTGVYLGIAYLDFVKRDRD